MSPPIPIPHQTPVTTCTTNSSISVSDDTEPLLDSGCGTGSTGNTCSTVATGTARGYRTAPPQPQAGGTGTISSTCSSSKPRGGLNASLNHSSNILLVYRLQEMRQLANVNFSLALLCLVYCGINMTLIFVNYVNSHYEGEEKDAPVSPIMFHLVEFWATFCFAILECISLISTPKALRTIYNDPLMLKLILFFNIVASFVPALLVTMNLELFEVVSHEIEYVNEITLTFVDMVLLWSIFQWDTGADDDCCDNDNDEDNDDDDDKFSYSKLFMTCLAAMVALVQLGCYNLMGRTSDGDMRGEVLAHYCEFIFEIISSLIAFFFCLENKFIADKEIGLILYGTHNDGLGCHICHDQSIQFEQTYFLPPHNSNYHHHQQKGLDHTAARLQRQGGGDNQQAQSSSVLPHHSTYGSLS